MKIILNGVMGAFVELDKGEEYPSEIRVKVDGNRIFNKRICNKCGIVFYHRKDKSSNICSNKCRFVEGRDYFIVNCFLCGKEKRIKASSFTKSKNKKFFCSRECKDKQERRKIKNCISCGTKLSGKQRKYCSHKCSHYHRRKILIKNWLSGNHNGSDSNGQLKKGIRDYLLEKHNYKCCKCGWDIPNPITGKAILTISHIDGNPSNHNPDNLEVLCYNCHTLTPSFGSLNIGKGRGSVGVAR